MSAPTPPPPPHYDPNNPKAAAKAAKAYAKASRPWFKKKRWWLLAAIVVVVIIIVASTSGGSKGPTVVSDGGKSTTTGKSGTTDKNDSGSAAVGTKDNPAKIGTTLELAGTRYKVKSVKTEKSIDIMGTPAAKADGEYVLVTLTIENVKNETHTFDEDAAKLTASDGTTYSTSDDNIYTDKPLILEEMQPNLPKTGTLLFDIPPSVAKGSLLKVSDLFGDGDAYIDLGLK